MSHTLRNVKVGPVEWMSGDDPYRPSLWIKLPRSLVVCFFGWQWPSVLWLR